MHTELRVPLPHAGCIVWRSALISGKNRSQSQNKCAGANLQRKKKEWRLLVSLCMKRLMAQLIRGPQLDTPISDHKKGTPSKNQKKDHKISQIKDPKRFHCCQMGPKLWTTSRGPKGYPNKWAHLGPQSRNYIPNPGNIPLSGVLNPNRCTLPPTGMYKINRKNYQWPGEWVQNRVLCYCRLAPTA